MSEDDWRVGYARTLAVFLNGDGGEKTRAGGRPSGWEHDDSFLVLCNANREAMVFSLPPELRADTWQVTLDSALVARADEPVDPEAPLSVAGFSVVLLRRLTSRALPIR
jgi:glycogen operon protein